MKVRAINISDKGVENRVVGYYGHTRIREGQIFDLVPYKTKEGKNVTAEDQFSKKWMERVEGSAKQKPAPAKETEPSGGEDVPTGDGDVI